MEDIKPIVAKNIAALRTASGMTQIQLAEKLNYSDKAVSKWERGESLPDVAVLTQIADLFGVPLDYLVRSEHEVKPSGEKLCEGKPPFRRKLRNQGMITLMSIAVVWLVAALIFIIVHMTPVSGPVEWLIFVYAVPATGIVWLVFNSVWFNRRRNFLIISLLMWSGLLTTYLTLLFLGVNVWMVFLLGVPGQIIVFMWSRLRNDEDESDTK